MKDKIKVIIADDHKIFTEGLKTILENSGDILVEDIVSDGIELLSVLKTDMNLIILLDINMPNLNGLDASLKITQQFPLIKIIIVSTYNEGHLIQKAKQFGCKGYFVKTSDKSELLLAIKIINEGGEYFEIEKSNIKSFEVNDNLLKKYKLTRRELEILELLKQELTNKEISDKLYLSIYTIETHRKNIMQKLDLKSPASLLKFFINNDNL